MKQLIIAKKFTTEVSAMKKGELALVDILEGTLLTKVPTRNFSVILKRGENEQSLYFSEVDAKSLHVEKATYQAGAKFKATITIPTPTIGKEYTVIVVKNGAQFNERNKWSFNALAKTTIAADVAKVITDTINANTINLGVTATYAAGAITIQGTEFGKDYTILGADELMGVKPTAVTTGKKATLDKAFVQDLASRCAAGKGFNYTDDPKIYPGYPEVVEDTQYTMYSLRFAVPRVAAKQRDEVVWQVLHIVVPSTSNAVAKLDTIFGIATPSVEP